MELFVSRLRNDHKFASRFASYMNGSSSSSKKAAGKANRHA